MLKKQNFLLLVVLLLVGACSPNGEKKETTVTQPKYVKVSGDAFGTMYNITYEIEGGRLLKNEIDSVLKAFDASLSTYNPNSLISKVNKEDSVKVDKYFSTVFDKAISISKATGGSFDVTIAPIVNVWGFGFTKKSEVKPELIKALLQNVGYEKVSIENGYVKKADPSVMFDFNAIAKGYGVDVVADYLRSQNIKNFLVEIGGEIVASGLNPKQKNWSVGIDKPRDNAAPGEELQAIVRFSNKALATSGNYRRFYVRDGVKYAHTLNPKTGFPVQHSLLSATVVAEDCMTADGYATAFMVMGVEKSKEFLKNHPELEVFLVYSDTQGRYLVWETEGMKGMIQEL